MHVHVAHGRCQGKQIKCEHCDRYSDVPDPQFYRQEIVPTRQAQPFVFPVGLGRLLFRTSSMGAWPGRERVCVLGHSGVSLTLLLCSDATRACGLSRDIGERYARVQSHTLPVFVVFLCLFLRFSSVNARGSWTVGTSAFRQVLEVRVGGGFELLIRSWREHFGCAQGGRQANPRRQRCRRALKHWLLSCLWMNPNSCAEFPIEKACAQKHAMHVIHTWHVPFWQVAVERCCTKEHSSHVLHPWHVPPRDVAVEQFSTSKYAAHVSDTWYVPRPDWSLSTLWTFAFWRQFEACVNGTFELYFGSRRKCYGGCKRKKSF